MYFLVFVVVDQVYGLVLLQEVYSVLIVELAEQAHTQRIIFQMGHSLATNCTHQVQECWGSGF